MGRAEPQEAAEAVKPALALGKSCQEEKWERLSHLEGRVLGAWNYACRAWLILLTTRLSCPQQKPWGSEDPAATPRPSA